MKDKDQKLKPPITSLNFSVGLCAEFLDEVLRKPLNGKMCFRCGEAQTHRLIYCAKCGDMFKGENLTMLDGLRIAKGKKLTLMRPDYIVAIHWRKLKKYEVSKADCIEYIASKIST